MSTLTQIRKRMEKRVQANVVDRVESIKEARRMHSAGFSIAGIAREAGVSEGAVRKWLKEGE